MRKNGNAVMEQLFGYKNVCMFLIVLALNLNVCMKEKWLLKDLQFFSL